MTALPFQLDPDVEHILQEVARDPRSSLLRVQRPKIIRGLLEREPSVGVATAGLTSAERHLVQTRRAETAFALRALCLQLLLGDPRAEFVFSRQGAASEQELTRLLSNIRQAWSSDEAEHVKDLGADASIARNALTGHRLEAPDVLQLTALAQRLEPTNFGRLYAAAWLLLESQPRSAIGLLSNIMAYPDSSLMSAAVGTNLGLAYHRLGLYDRSLAWYRRASEEMSTYVPGVVGRLVLALQLGIQEEAIQAGKILDDLNTHASSELAWQCHSEGARRSQFQANLSKRARELLPHLRDQLGPASRTLVHALE